MKRGRIIRERMRILSLIWLVISFYIDWSKIDYRGREEGDKRVIRGSERGEGIKRVRRGSDRGEGDKRVRVGRG